mmetsp:Transcript_19335/g.58345  ORF Transcript_19335/g.58345 Transcript_19335/m.58345 type:complete len:227 (-) Transcript_19335:1709-2389(-)
MTTKRSRLRTPMLVPQPTCRSRKWCTFVVMGFAPRPSSAMIIRRSEATVAIRSATSSGGGRAGAPASLTAWAAGTNAHRFVAMASASLAGSCASCATIITRLPVTAAAPLARSSPASSVLADPPRPKTCAALYVAMACASATRCVTMATQRRQPASLVRPSLTAGRVRVAPQVPRTRASRATKAAPRARGLVATSASLARRLFPFPMAPSVWLPAQRWANMQRRAL